ERLFAVVEAACELSGAETVMDLYSGTGAISLLLARRSRWVYGIEVSTAAVDDAVRNARENGIANCTFLPGEVRHILPTLMRDGVRPDVVVADPPRAGFHPKPLNALAALARPRPGAPGARVGQPVHARGRRRRPGSSGLSPRVGRTGRHVSADAAHRGRRPSPPGVMKIFLARRLAQSLLVLLGVSFIVFFIL